MRASDRAYAALLEEIQSGALAPGTVLGEAEQAARLGVSRTPLREALARLSADGLLVQVSPRVTVVAGLDAADIRALFELRRALEEAAARLAAERGDRHRFAALADEFGARHGGDDLDAYYALISRFDVEIDAAVANAHLVSALRTVRAHLARVRRIARDNPERIERSAREHEGIARAIAEGDGELAAHATHVHLHNALAGVLASLETPRTDAPAVSQGAA